MALPKETNLYGVDDCKIFEIIEDSASAFTLGSAIDVPGIRQISLTIEKETKKNTGDEKTLAIRSKITSATIKAEHAELSLDVLKLTTGSSLTTTGSGSSETHKLSIGADSVDKYFQIQAQIKNESGGDAHIVVYKAKATATPINGVQNDFSSFTFDCEGVFTEFEFTNEDASTESKLAEITLNATATDLAAVGTVAPGTLLLKSDIVKTNSGGLVGATLSGTVFASEAASELLTNYTFSYGTTGLTVTAANYVNANTVVFTTTGTAAAGTLSITAKAAACSNGLAATAGTFVIAP